MLKKKKVIVWIVRLCLKHLTGTQEGREMVLRMVYDGLAETVPEQSGSGCLHFYIEEVRRSLPEWVTDFRFWATASRISKKGSTPPEYE